MHRSVQENQIHNKVQQYKLTIGGFLVFDEETSQMIVNYEKNTFLEIVF